MVCMFMICVRIAIPFHDGYLPGIRESHRFWLDSDRSFTALRNSLGPQGTPFDWGSTPPLTLIPTVPVVGACRLQWSQEGQTSCLNGERRKRGAWWHQSTTRWGATNSKSIPLALKAPTVASMRAQTPLAVNALSSCPCLRMCNYPSRRAALNPIYASGLSGPCAGVAASAFRATPSQDTTPSSARGGDPGRR